ncbi:MAG TPA: alanine--glyoxylate aminotransferase family protein [Anaeromyxobacteraceae bacterium]|nr:alanine--glyoxylate aminotransferase family protein [Anaeromyxobacteraceae bacterium]
MSIPAPTVGELSPSVRLLLGPGPSPVHPRVYRALGTPQVGHLDPLFLGIMNEVQAQLRYAFQTANPFTIAVSGTGSAGMEAALVNVIEPGDNVIVCAAGVFGNRMADIVGRCGGKLVKLEVPWGQVFPHAAIEEALKKNAPVKAVCIVHAETSTGAQQPMDGLGDLCHRHGALLVVDTVTSLGGVPVTIDAWGADAVYSGTQKCLSCPPGLAPFTLSPRALDVVRARKTKVQSWYLDAGMVADYWAEGKRVYHHTAPISMVYALREALRLVAEEGLEVRFARHRRNSAALVAGMGAIGARPLSKDGERLPSLNAFTPPEGVDEAAVRKALLAEHDIEIGGGLGPLAGKLWRIGLMGYGSTQANVVTVLSAIEQALRKQGRKVPPGAAVSAALAAYDAG